MIVLSITVAALLAVSSGAPAEQKNADQAGVPAVPSNTVDTSAPRPPNDAIPTPGRPHLSPRNLQVFPKDGKGLIEAMREWTGDLGVTCSGCHNNSKVRDVNGNIHNDMADDSRPEFKTTRRMYLMTVEMNSKYMASNEAPVTCGTCHRGHMIPEKFVVQGAGQQQPRN
jgi:hypothetical protein